MSTITLYISNGQRMKLNGLSNTFIVRKIFMQAQSSLSRDRDVVSVALLAARPFVFNLHRVLFCVC